MAKAQIALIKIFILEIFKSLIRDVYSPVQHQKWIHLKIMSHSPTFHSRWPPLIKIEFSLIDHYFFILHQNELKFKMLLHDSAGNFKFVSNSIAINPRWPLLPKKGWQKLK
jgi:hypothetical protein